MAAKKTTAEIAAPTARSVVVSGKLRHFYEWFEQQPDDSTTCSSYTCSFECQENVSVWQVRGPILLIFKSMLVKFLMKLLATDT